MQLHHTKQQTPIAQTIAEMDEQIEESKEHAARFQATLTKAARRFAALAKVEERHANHYKATRAKIAEAAWSRTRSIREAPSSLCQSIPLQCQKHPWRRSLLLPPQCPRPRSRP